MFPHLSLFDHIRSRNVDEVMIKELGENNYDDNFISNYKTQMHTRTRVFLCECFYQVIIISVFRY